AVGSRLTDGTAGVRAERKRHFFSGDAGGGAARGAARHTGWVPGVIWSRLKGAGFAGRAESELIQVGFAKDQCACVDQLPHGGSGVGRFEVPQDARSSRGFNALQGEDVLDRDGYASQGAWVFTRGDLTVDFVRLLAGEVLGEADE